MSNYNTTLQSNNTDLQAILNTINELPNAGGEQATPVISVNSTNGLVTATAGTKTGTKQLAFQPAKTITPSTASQIAVSSGYYTGGNIMVAGDANLVAGNIKSGVSIFGVSGNYAGSGGSGDTNINSLINRNITTCTNSTITKIGSHAFHFTKLKNVNFPAVTDISYCAFARCFSLTTISFPVAINIRDNAFEACIRLESAVFPCARSIGSDAFTNCSALSYISFPVAYSISNSAFKYCKNLTTVSFPKVAYINSHAFGSCSNLSTIYLLRSDKVCALDHSNAFANTGIRSNKGSIFVPSSLVASYKTATNWAFFSARIFRTT